jgi:hypothetical protein
MNAHRPGTSTSRRAHPLMSALALGLPITLLVDLIDPNGPRSHEMFDLEDISPDAAVLTIPEAARACTG